MRIWTGLQQNLLLGSCEYGNEKKGSVKVRNFLEQPRELKVPKDGCAPWSWSLSNMVVIFSFVCSDEEWPGAVTTE
jgi:hypothetical protein